MRRGATRCRLRPTVSSSSTLLRPPPSRASSSPSTISSAPGAASRRHQQRRRCPRPAAARGRGVAAPGREQPLEHHRPRTRPRGELVDERRATSSGSCRRASARLHRWSAATPTPSTVRRSIARLAIVDLPRPRRPPRRPRGRLPAGLTSPSPIPSRSSSSCSSFGGASSNTSTSSGSSSRPAPRSLKSSICSAVGLAKSMSSGSLSASFSSPSSTAKKASIGQVHLAALRSSARAVHAVTDRRQQQHRPYLLDEL